MRRFVVPIFLSFMVLLTFALRATFLWRDFVFVYDQGRDALAVDGILHGHLTLIGPTTGLSGVFLGPFFYYLLAPLYFLGRGNPIVPAYIFVFLSSVTIVPIFYLARKIAGTISGILAVLMFAFSFVEWQYARWLSNPTPLPLVSLLMFLCVLKALHTKKVLWYALIGLSLGLCLQLEAANAFFLIPALIGILLLEYRISYNKKWIERLIVDWRLVAASVGVFVMTLLPQFFFEVKHGFITTKALLGSFQTSSGTVAPLNLMVRAKLLFDLYAYEWFTTAPWREAGFAIVIIGLILIALFVGQKLWRRQTFRVVILWFFIPFVFHLFYNGNHGNFWDYYIIGQYIPLYILASAILITGLMSKGYVRFLSLVFLILISVFLVIPNVREWFGLFVPYNDRISLSLQLDAIDWVESRAAGQPFGEWAYTASAQDEVYKYLFAFRSRTTGIRPVEHPEHTRLMYLIVEDDPNNPKRRIKWIQDLAAVGNIDATAKFGAVSVFEVIRK